MTLALALAHTAKPQPFNGLFYATCATVIPVLFLAIALQGVQPGLRLVTRRMEICVPQ